MMKDNSESIQQVFHIMNEEFKNNKEISEQTKIKLIELEEQVKKKSKKFSFIENLNVSGFSSNLTGINA